MKEQAENIKDVALKLADEVEIWGEDLLALNMKGGIPVTKGAKMIRRLVKELDENQRTIEGDKRLIDLLYKKVRKEK
jgi:hypothetical protein